MTEGTEAHSGRVLVVEDEMMISMLLEDMLGELGYETVGPASRLESALDMARDADVQAAILDVNLHGRPTWPVAEILRERGIPFMFATGYGGQRGWRSVTAARLFCPNHSCATNWAARCPAPSPPNRVSGGGWRGAAPAPFRACRGRRVSSAA